MVGLSCPEGEGLPGGSKWCTDKDIFEQVRPSDPGRFHWARGNEELNLPNFADPSTSGAEPEKLDLPAITPKKVEGSAESTFILCEALPVVPAKLVKWIRKADYVDILCWYFEATTAA